MFENTSIMFKVQDNPDGTTSIYCKNSGNLLCTIPGKKNSTVPRRVNVVEPQPVANVSQASSWNGFETERSLLDNGVSATLKDGKVPHRSRESKCCISPIPINFDGDQTEDYFDDCITQDEFAKCLNLISRDKMKNESRENLLAEYPLRLLSRSKAYRTLEDSPTEDLRDLKLPDDMDLTSHLGVKIMKLNKQKNFVDSQRIAMAFKKFTYCRVPFKTPTPNSCHFPKLRCREKKQYPISTSSKILKQDVSHYYTYGRKQRLERYTVLKTGLTARSRRLLHLCKRKTLAVSMERLSEEEIELWRQKRSTVCRPINREIAEVYPLLYDIREPYIATLAVLNPKRAPLRRRVLALRAPSAVTYSRNHRTKQRTKSSRNPVVYLKNILGDIKRVSASYFVKRTSIEVPFFGDFMSSLRSKRSSITDMLHRVESNSGVSDNHANLCARSSDAGPSHCSGRTAWKTNPSRTDLAKSSSSTRGKPSLLTRHLTPIRPQNTTPRRSRPAPPIIDLTEESPKESSSKCLVPRVRERFLVSQWKFHCFGCGFQRFYFSNSSFHSQSVETAVSDHLMNHHAVSDPETFLSRYLDVVNHCTVIEAFPGYKHGL